MTTVDLLHIKFLRIFNMLELERFCIRLEEIQNIFREIKNENYILTNPVVADAIESSMQDIVKFMKNI